MGWLGNAFGCNAARWSTIGGSLIGAAAVVCAAPAASAHGSSVPGGLNTSLRIKVVGEIAPSCALTQSTRDVSFDVLDEVSGGTRDASVELPFAVDCNSAFKLSLNSRNGALDFDGASQASSAFRRSIDYRTEVRLPGGVGGVVRCGSAAMSRRGGCGAEVATDAVVHGPGTIKILVARDGQPLLRGVYSDTLTLTLQPRLGGDGRN